jgi:hypothetical protein
MSLNTQLFGIEYTITSAKNAIIFIILVKCDYLGKNRGKNAIIWVKMRLLAKKCDY